MSRSADVGAIPSFKGIALFTPGGDLVYCIDPQKRDRWHLDLCAVLQETLSLPEPPHFLVPCYSASVDCWISPQTQERQIFAEACPRVLKHQAILNAIFQSGDLDWQPAAISTDLCDSLVLSTYRQQFPQLWENHDLIIRFDRAASSSHLKSPHAPEHNQSHLAAAAWTTETPAKSQGYVLRLYVTHGSGMTERVLQNLHQLLEQALHQPYTLKVVDAHKHPDQAEADQITATPTLVRVYPPPVRRLVGDLDNLSKILQVLSLSEL